MNRREMKTRLRLNSRRADGVLWIRLADAARALDTRASSIQPAMNRRDARKVRLPDRKRNGGIAPVAVFYRTRDVLRFWCRRRMAWTPEQDDYLLEHAGVLPLAKIAEAIGRTSLTCSQRLRNLGITARSATGLWSTGDIAKIVGRSREAVQQWQKLGLRPKHRSLAPGHPALFEPQEVRRFLANRPTILGWIGPLARKELGLPMPNDERRAA